MHKTVAVWLCLSLASFYSFGQGEVEKLPPGINTDLYDETTPVLSMGGDKLFFTRTAYPDFNTTLANAGEILHADKDSPAFTGQLADIYSQLAGRPVEDPVSSVYNQDIWYALITNDTVGEVFHPGYPVNSALPNSVVSAGMMPHQYILLNQFEEDGGMRTGFSGVTMHDEGNIPFPEPIHIYEFSQTGSDVHMTMSQDGNFIVLSMQRPDGIGSHDLYVCFYLRPNVWSAPVHMGNGINSPWRESTPFLSHDRRYLYFSSDRPGGAGGSDIYRSERLDYTWLKWSAPVLIGGQANSPADESHPYFDREGRHMYFTSRRDGSSDIFRMRLTPLPQLKKPVYIKGKIISSATGKPVRSELYWGQESSKEFLEFYNTYTGEFEVTLTEYEPYKFLPRKPNHTGSLTMVDPRQLDKEGKDTIELALYLQPKALAAGAVSNEIRDAGKSQMTKNNDRPLTAEELTPGKKISFYDIHFVRSKAVILASSKGALDYLYTIMHQHHGLEILITGHTDNIGEETALMVLSQQRAEAVRDELVKRGIPVSRMRVAGMGAAQPVSPNDTESGREKNRRVEIHILKS